MSSLLATLSPVLNGLAVTALISCVVLLVTYIFTTVQYYIAVRRFQDPRLPKQVSPPQIPFLLPWLGNSLDFLSQKRGSFYEKLFGWYPRENGACTILLGGRPSHLLFNPAATQALLKARGPTRDDFNQDVVVKGFGAWPASESQAYYGLGEGPDETGLTPVEQQEKVLHDFLLKADRVNELTSRYIEVLMAQLENELNDEEEAKEFNLYVWLRNKAFYASTVAFFGSRLPELYPDLESDFYKFDERLLEMFFGTPRWLASESYRIRDRCLKNFGIWTDQMYRECDGKIPDPYGPTAWDPRWGSRYNRARQIYYRNRNLLVRTMASMDLGTMFGISSNAIPAAGWMMFHILNTDPSSGGDPTLLPRILAELQEAVKPDGTLDIPVLVNQPLLLSTFHEMLRLYTDVLVSRSLPADISLPLDENKAGTGKSLLLKKNSYVFVPSWLAQRNPKLWTTPQPCDVFCAERFLSLSDPNNPNSKPVFSTSSTGGRLFPFGGGKTICPGRVFAKQEILATVAILLLEYDFEVLGFVDLKKDGKSFKNRKEFPGLKNGFPGPGIIGMDGDVKVRMKRRVKKA